MMGGEHPFISGSDETAFDPWLEFKRTLESTGERWLNHREAIDLLQKREPMPIGAAEAILDDLRVAYFADGGAFARQSGKSTAVRWHWFHDTDFQTNKPNRGNTFVSEADLIYWHDRNRTPTATAQPPKGRTGRPQTHDWGALEEKFWQLWEEQGDFRKPENQITGWNSQAAAAQTLLGFIRKGEPPDPKTIERHISEWLSVGRN